MASSLSLSSSLVPTAISARNDALLAAASLEELAEAAEAEPAKAMHAIVDGISLNRLVDIAKDEQGEISVRVRALTCMARAMNAATKAVPAQNPEIAASVATAMGAINDAVASSGAFADAPQLLAEAGADAAEALFATPQARGAVPSPADATPPTDESTPSPLWRALAAGYAPLLAQVATKALQGHERRATDDRVAAANATATMIYASASVHPLAVALTDEGTSVANALNAVRIEDGTETPPGVAASMHGIAHRALRVSHAPMLVAAMRFAAALAECAASPLAKDQAPLDLLAETAESPSIWDLLLDPPTRDAFTSMHASQRLADVGGDAANAAAGVLLSWRHTTVVAGARGMEAAAAAPGASETVAKCASALAATAAKGPWGDAVRSDVATSEKTKGL